MIFPAVGERKLERSRCGMFGMLFVVSLPPSFCVDTCLLDMDMSRHLPSSSFNAISGSKKCRGDRSAVKKKIGHGRLQGSVPGRDFQRTQEGKNAARTVQRHWKNVSGVRCPGEAKEGKHVDKPCNRCREHSKERSSRRMFLSTKMRCTIESRRNHLHDLESTIFFEKRHKKNGGALLLTSK